MKRAWSRAASRSNLRRLGQALRYVCRKHGAATHNRPYSSNQFLIHRVLGKVTGGSCRDGFGNDLMFEMNTQDENASGHRVNDLTHTLDAALLWHGNVHNDDVGFQLFSAFHSLSPGRGLSDNRHIPLRFENPAEPLPKYGVIISEE